MRLRRAAATLATLATLASPAVATAGPAASMPRTTSVATGEPVVALTGPTMTVLGKGFGHGRGMSQYGAAARAQAGQTWQQITSFSYPGATPTQASTATIRVGLADSIGTGLAVLPRAGLAASDGSTTRTLPASADIVRWEVTPGPGTTAQLGYVTSAGAHVAWRTAPSAWSLTSTDGILVTTTTSGATGPAYLGRLTATRSATSIAPVLETSLESYVRMVVPSESYPTWPVQALAAQAVAARTYAVSYQRTHATSLYDICSSTRCQVVGSITHESANSRAGVAATPGVILTSGGTPIRAEFSSSNGGASAAGGSSYLPAQADPYDRSTLNPMNSWRADIPVATLAAKYPAIGRPTGIQVLTRDGNGDLGGRVLTARVIGTAGSTTVTGDALRTALGTGVLRSTLFAIVPAPTAAAAKSAPVPVIGLGSSGLAGGGTARTLTAATAPRLLTQVGSWDAVPGTDALGISPTGDLVLVSDVSGAAAAPRVIASGFGDVRAIAALDDVNGDRQRDLVVTRADGRLVRYTANGAGGILPGSGTVVGSGWGAIPSITGADVDGDGHDELVAQLPTGTIVAYPVTRDVFGARRVIGTAPVYRNLVSAGERTGDARTDLAALDTTGTAWLLPMTSSGSVGAPTRLPAPTGALRLL